MAENKKDAIKNEPTLRWLPLPEGISEHIKQRIYPEDEMKIIPKCLSIGAIDGVIDSRAAGYISILSRTFESETENFSNGSMRVQSILLVDQNHNSLITFVRDDRVVGDTSSNTIINKVITNVNENILKPFSVETIPNLVV